MNNKFCAAPWSHIHAWATGDVYPCCYADVSETEPYGNLRETTIPELINSKAMKELRRRMLNGEYSSVCKKCYIAEEHGMGSFRAMFNREFLGKSQEAIAQTDEVTGYLDPKLFRVRYWDVRISNLCNMKCRTCGPEFSTKWYDEVSESHRHVVGFSRLQKAREDIGSLVDEIPDFFNTVEKIYFAGGEPLIMDEHWYIIDQLIAAGRFDVEIEYQTNLSKLTYKSRSFDDVLRQFSNVKILASIDDIRARGTLIRHGIPNKKVMDNLRHIKENFPNTDLWVSCTVSKLNAFSFLDFYKELVDDGYIEPDNFSINPVYEPDFYALNTLPDSLQARLVERIDAQLSTIPYMPDRIKSKVQALLSYSSNKSSNADELHKDFIATSGQLDTIRKEQSYKVLPEYFVNDTDSFSNAVVISRFSNSDIQLVDRYDLSEIRSLRQNIEHAVKKGSQDHVIIDWQSKTFDEMITRFGHFDVTNIQLPTNGLLALGKTRFELSTASMIILLWNEYGLKFDDLVQIKEMVDKAVIIDSSVIIEGLRIVEEVYENTMSYGIFHHDMSTVEDKESVDITYFDIKSLVNTIVGLYAMKIDIL